MAIHQVSYMPTQVSQQHILHTLRARRQAQPGYSVLDMGGAWSGWSAPVTDLLVDIASQPRVSATGVPQVLCLDMCREDSWHALREHIQVHRAGRPFDYVICTHTLEDLPNPDLALSLLPTVALSGVISMPCLRDELSAWTESPAGTWLGYIHHRWIFDQARSATGDIIMTLTPKLSLLEALCRIEHDHQPDARSQSIMYQWTGSIPHDHLLMTRADSGSLHDRYRAFIRGYVDPLGPLPVTGQRLRGT
jgi:hypothetical protein